MHQNPAISEQPVNSQNNQQAPPQQQKKKVRQTFTLKPEHFEKKNGLESLYKAVSSLDLTNGTENTELTMKKIVSVLKTWNFQMAPRYEFDYFLQRCRALGNHKFTQSYMSNVRRIHKGEDKWENEIPQETDALNNIELDHLNPNRQEVKRPSQILQQKIQNAMKLVHQIENRSLKQTVETFPQKMEIEREEMNRFQDELNQDDEEDECEKLLKQMDELQNQKKLLFSKNKQDQKVAQTSNATKKSQPVQYDEQEPYVPEGFEDIDYGQESSYND